MGFGGSIAIAEDIDTMAMDHDHDHIDTEDYSSASYVVHK